MEIANNWLLWQVADSAFPTGGFAHSGGLEAAWRNGEIPCARDLASFLEAHLCQTASSMIPFVAAGHGAPEDIDELNAHCDAFLTNHVANRASRLQGRAFLNSVSRIFGAMAGFAAVRDPCHLAPIFGAAGRRLSLELSTTKQLFMFQSLRSVLASAVRLGIIGPTEAQVLQYRMSGRAEQWLASLGEVGLDDIATTSPLLEIWQGTHDRLYSRLFQT